VKSFEEMWLLGTETFL